MTQVNPGQGIQHYDHIQNGLDIGSVMMMVNLERATIMESQVMEQAQRMKEINTEIKVAQHFMAEARKYSNKDTHENTGGSHTIAEKYGSVTLQAFCTHRGFPITDTTPQGWEQMLERFKNHVDGLNSNSQLEMIKLQSLINKRNQAFEMSSNHVNKFAGTLDKIIGNMR